MHYRFWRDKEESIDVIGTLMIIGGLFIIGMSVIPLIANEGPNWFANAIGVGLCLCAIFLKAGLFVGHMAGLEEE